MLAENESGDKKNQKVIREIKKELKAWNRTKLDYFFACHFNLIIKKIFSSLEDLKISDQKWLLSKIVYACQPQTVFTGWGR